MSITGRRNGRRASARSPRSGEGATRMSLGRRALPLLLAAACAAGTAGAAAAQTHADRLTPTPIRGAAGGNVIVLFSDFACPYCARVGAVLDEAERRFPGQLRIVFKHLPLPIHPQAPLAHMATVLRDCGCRRRLVFKPVDADLDQVPTQLHPSLHTIDELAMDQFGSLVLIGGSEVMTEVVNHVEGEETER